MKFSTQVVWLAAALMLLISSCSAPRGGTTTQSPPGPTVPGDAPTTLPPSEPTPTAVSTEQPTLTLFDDFDYTAHAEMTANGWVIRDKSGWPGIPGATFRPENITFEEDAQIPNNRFVRMTSSTDGSSTGTFQTQICHQRKYLEGTYGARVRFSSAPAAGPDGDQVVETFYAITPYEEAMDPAYSEMDFEYLPNGGWGFEPMTLMTTTWETVRIEPWLADNASNSVTEDLDGWHTLTLQVGDGKVRYYVSGKLVAEHGGNYYPDSPMSPNFNLWFINGGLMRGGEVRSYQEDVDWVFHEAGVILSPEQVNKKVRAMREGGLRFLDTVPPASPALESLCDL